MEMDIPCKICRNCLRLKGICSLTKQYTFVKISTVVAVPVGQGRGELAARAYFEATSLMPIRRVTDSVTAQRLIEEGQAA